jgi:protein-disulfide isomerase
VLLGAAAVLGIVVLGYAATQGGGGAPITIDPSTATGTVEGYVIGPASAPIEIIEYADFECPGCGQFATVTEPDVRTRIVDAGLARFRFLDYPLDMHRNAVPAHLAAACAAEQGKFWEMHDALFNAQDRWNGSATRNPKSVFSRLADEVGLDEDAWDQCYDSRRPLPKISSSVAQGQRARVGGTPTFIIGDQMVSDVLSYDQIKAMVDTAIARKARTDTTSRRPPGR